MSISTNANNFDVIIAGAGAAGLFAAISAANEGAKVLVIEKNEKVGKKIYITGKGRCNVTNACDTQQFIKNIVTNPKFLYPTLSAFTPNDLIRFFEDRKCKIVVERGNRAFPASYKASDITKTLLNEALSLGVKFLYNTSVNNIIVENNAVIGINTIAENYYANAVIIATGGKSYPLTGSTGDGYSLLEKVGHKIETVYPALVPIESNKQWIKELQGLSLRNVDLTLTIKDKIKYKERGEMMFTHFGITGPLVLSASSYMAGNAIEDCKISLDLKPALSKDQLNKRIIREIESNPRRQVATMFNSLFPARLANVIVNLCELDTYLPSHQITKENRQKIVDITKNLEIPLSKTRPIEEAIITHGGACVKEFIPATLQSKLVNGLFVVGELLNIDALTGGFNLHIAFATGNAAGIEASNINK